MKSLKFLDEKSQDYEKIKNLIKLEENYQKSKIEEISEDFNGMKLLKIS